LALDTILLFELYSVQVTARQILVDANAGLNTTDASEQKSMPYLISKPATPVHWRWPVGGGWTQK
jgi:hypothetical protein